MRYYGFSNMYLSSIQVGIQNAHCLVRIGRIFDDVEAVLAGNTPHIDYAEWADKHETMICLNGGNQADLLELVAFLKSKSNEFAWGTFNEDQASLNGCLTCVGIILPERIYETAQLLREDRTDTLRFMIQDDFTAWELELMKLLNTFRLAN